MSNSTEGDYDKNWLLVATSGISISAGLLVQFFIVAVNVIDRLNGQLMKPTDLMITSIGLSRFFCLISSLLHMFSSLYPTKFHPTFCLFVLLNWQASDFCSIWLSALLSIFFCLRISTFHNAFFLYLRVIMSTRVVYLIIASVLLGFVNPFVYLVNIFIGNVSENCIIDSEKPPLIVLVFHYLCSLLPLLMNFASSVLLVISLSLHMSRMKSSTHVMSSTDTYNKTIMFTVVCFLTGGLCITVNITEQYGLDFFGLLWMFLIWNLFPVLHSVCLIYVTTKLKDRFYMIIRCATDCLFKKKPDARSGETIQVTPL